MTTKEKVIIESISRIEKQLKYMLMKTKIILFIRDLINPKTKLITVKEEWYYEEDMTECCGVAPITNEKYCPNCGRKIIKK